MLLPNIDAAYSNTWKRSIKDPSSHQKFLGLLSRVPIFSQLSEPFRASVCEALQPVQYEPGQVVYHQGDVGDWIGLLVCGKLECHLDLRRTVVSSSGRRAEVTKRRSLKEVVAGGTVGEINVLGIRGDRCATVTATVQSTLLVLSRESFKAAVTTPKDAAFIESIGDLRGKAAADSKEFCYTECFRKLGFAPDFVAALFGYVERRVLYPGHVLMREGGFGNEMYILDAGRLKVEKANKHISTLSDGVSLGELAVLGSDKRWRTTVVCTSPCLVTVLQGDVFNELLEDFPHCRSAFHHAYIKTLVSDGLMNASDEMNKLDKFYGKVHPMNTAALLDHGFGGEGLAQVHKMKSRTRSKDVSSRPGTARKYVPMKVPSRPSTAMGIRRERPISPDFFVDRRCHSSCA